MRETQRTAAPVTDTILYQHDGAKAFQFILRGELSGAQVTNLEHAWTTAESTAQGKHLALDVSGITDADPAGVELLNRMRNAGVRLTAAAPPESEEFVRSLGLPVATSRSRCDGRMGRLLQSAGLCRKGVAKPVSGAPVSVG